MVNITLGSLVAAVPALQRLAELRLPVKTAYHLAKLLRAVQQEAAEFETQRIALLKQYGEERDATLSEQAQFGAARVTVVPAVQSEAFSTALKALTALEVDVPLQPLTLAELGDATVAGNDLCLLGALLADPETKEAG